VAECINVFKVKTKLNSTGFATVGDEIGVVINKARPIALASSSAASNIQKVRKGDMRRAVVVRTKKTELRADGRYVKLVPSSILLLDWYETDGRFDDTACVLLNTKGDMIGTRVSGPVSSELRDIPGGAGGPAGRWSKILSLAPKVSLLVREEPLLMNRSSKLDRYTV
jgi:ribosomal protein L14